MTSPVAPVNFTSLPKKQQFAFQQVLNKVVTNCALQRQGNDLLMQVYLAGLYHGTQAAEGWPKEGAENG